jgi:Arc/MetJ-type ribon-helix-helix transcriptional regulator
MSHYKLVSLPSSIVEEIETFIETNYKMGYTSVSDFVRDSIRRNFEYLKTKK